MILTSKYRIMKHAAALLIVCILTSSAVAGQDKEDWSGFNLRSVEPILITNKSGRIIGLKNLSPDSTDCHRFPAEGVVIKKEYEADALAIKGFVLEGKEGFREYVNVSLNADSEYVSMLLDRLKDKNTRTD